MPESMRHRGLGAGGEGLPNSFESVLRNYHASQEADAILLSDGEVAVPRFMAHFEKYGPGTAVFMQKAMHVYSDTIQKG
jgi:hypothetical protein